MIDSTIWWLLPTTAESLTDVLKPKAGYTERGKQFSHVSNKPESLAVELSQDIEEGKGRAVQHPVRRPVWFLDVHRQSSVEELQTQLYVEGALT